MKTIINRLVIAGCAALFLTSCTAGDPSSAPTDTYHPAVQAGVTQYPITINTCGKSITITERPARAVALEQTQTEFLLTLGLESAMVGTSYLTDPILPTLEHSYDSVPVLAAKYPSHEVVLEVAPDFIYAAGSWAVADDAAGSRETWEKLEIPVYLSSLACDQTGVSDPTSNFDGIFTELRTLGEIFDVQDRAETVIADQQQRIDDEMATLPHNLSDKSLAWWYTGTRTPYFGGNSSAAGDFATRFGMENSFGNSTGRWNEANWEALADQDPDVLVLSDLSRGSEGDSAQAKIDFLENNPLTSQMSAVKNHRFVVVPGSGRDRSIRTITSFEAVSAGLREFFAQ
uniref:ABC transporter substrate-binding protein n=1 Tax=Rhodococcus erythropolis TaxID=1833 RepID=UPI001556C372|nr:ABC transporter substrate-binding protein [Rhodococcus erythropolis]